MKLIKVDNTYINPSHIELYFIRNNTRVVACSCGDIDGDSTLTLFTGRNNKHSLMMLEQLTIWLTNSDSGIFDCNAYNER